MNKLKQAGKNFQDFLKAGSTEPEKQFNFKGQRIEKKFQASAPFPTRE